MKWFKFYGQDWLTDHKIIGLSLEDRLCYLTILCLVASSDDSVIRNCSEETILKLTQLPWDPTRDDNAYDNAVGVIKRLHDNGMITIDNNGDVTVRNFVKRQGENLTSYERVKKYRDKAKNTKRPLKYKPTSSNVTGVIKDNAVNVINDTARIEENRIDKNRERVVANTPAREARDFFGGNTIPLFNEMKSKLSLDENLLKQEFIKFILYWTEKNKSGTKERWEQESTFEVKRRLATWLSRMKDFKNDKNKPNYIL